MTSPSDAYSDSVLQTHASSLGVNMPAAVRAATLRTRVLIVTDDVAGAATMIGRLRAEGLDVQLSSYDGENLSVVPEQPPAAILCFLTDYIWHAQQITDALKAQYAPREIPVIGRVERGAHTIDASELPFDSTLFTPVHPVQVAHRVSAIIRLGRMEREITRRLETIQYDFGETVHLDTASMDRPFKVLFIGKPAPSYMAVIHALQGQSVEIVAAFTSFSAFDYLHDNRFDAVVMNALDGPEPALTITQTMHKNPRLFHVPTLFLVDRSRFDQARQAFEVGARDLIDMGASSEEISNRILELANYYRLHDGLKSQFRNIGGARFCDPETGVFNSEFLARHLTRVSSDCRRNGIPLTVLAIKMRPNAEGEISETDANRAFAKAISLISNLVRVQDIVARISLDTIMVAFPEESEAAIQAVLDRMKGLIECAAFETEQGRLSPLTLQLDTAVIEQESYESTDLLIGSALRTVGSMSDIEAAPIYPVEDLSQVNLVTTPVHS